MTKTEAQQASYLAQVKGLNVQINPTGRTSFEVVVSDDCIARGFRGLAVARRYINNWYVASSLIEARS